MPKGSPPDMYVISRKEEYPFNRLYALSVRYSYANGSPGYDDVGVGLEYAYTGAHEIFKSLNLLNFQKFWTFSKILHIFK